MNYEFKGIDHEINLDEVRRVEYERYHLGLAPLNGVKKIYASSITAFITLFLAALTYVILIVNVPKVQSYFANFDYTTIIGLIIAGLIAIIVMNYYFFIEGDANIATMYMMALAIGTFGGFILSLAIGFSLVMISSFTSALTLLITIFMNSIIPIMLVVIVHSFLSVFIYGFFEEKEE